MPRNGSGVMSKPAGTTAVPNTTIESAKYNATIDDIIQDLNNARPITSGGTGATSVAAAQTALSTVGYSAQTLTAAQQAQARSNVSAALNGQLYGLTLSNNAGDVTNDIDIAVGEAASTEASPVLMVLASTMTKRTDAAWAGGSGNGGWLDGAAMPNGTGHVFLIQRSDTGAVDVGLSASLSPSLPTNYDRKRRVGSIMREAGAIVLFEQRGDNFRRGAVSIRSSTAAAADVLLTMPVPVGIEVFPILRSALRVNTSSNVANSIGSGYQSSAAYVYQQEIGTSAAGTTDSQMIPPVWVTNLSAQLRFSASINSGSIISNDLQLYGWVDTRGRS